MRPPLRTLPFPKHLRHFVRPVLARSKTDHEFVGRLRCGCSGMTFRLLFPGKTHKFQGRLTPVTTKVGGAYFFLIRAQCERCGREHLVFDQDLHGWNGFVCHNEAQASLPRPPLSPWRCLRCGEERHRGLVTVTSQGRTDFVEEAGPDFKPSQWAEGFESLSLELVCRGCSLQTSPWVACGAM